MSNPYSRASVSGVALQLPHAELADQVSSHRRVRIERMSLGPTGRASTVMWLLAALLIALLVWMTWLLSQDDLAPSPAIMVSQVIESR